MGIADRTYHVVQVAGSYGVGASFAGDSLYEGSSSQSSATVGVKGTNLTYTGALQGGPKKTVTLSAVLKDAEGKPLSGQTVQFTLGTQTVSAVTDANGIAIAPLKLNQKNGSYPLTATWTPSGADVAKYSGSADVETFKLQPK